MSKQQVIEAGLTLGGAALGLAGAVLIEPVVVGVGVVAAGTAAFMRYRNQQTPSTAHAAPITEVESDE